MTKATDIIPQEPSVFTRNGQVFTNSRDVAAYFDREHRSVLRKIDTLIQDEPDLALHHFVQGYEALPATGEQAHRFFDIDRDGFTLLAMGFTGSRALKWKLHYIAAFNMMEDELRRRELTPVANLGDATTLRTLLLGYTEKVIELEHRAVTAEAAVVVAMPKIAFYDQFADAEGLFGLQNAARALGQSPNKFIGWLKQGHLFYQGGVLVPYQRYRAQGLFEVKARLIDDKARYQTYVTAKGLRHLGGLLGVPVDLLSRVA